MLWCMRTTITLEDDVAASLKRLGKTRRLKFKALFNLVLREGIKLRGLYPYHQINVALQGLKQRHELIE